MWSSPKGIVAHRLRTTIPDRVGEDRKIKLEIIFSGQFLHPSLYFGHSQVSQCTQSVTTRLPFHRAPSLSGLWLLSCIFVEVTPLHGCQPPGFHWLYSFPSSCLLHEMELSESLSL